MKTLVPARNQVLRPKLQHGAQIKIIGLGGTGGILARYLCLFLASLQRELRVVLIDGDSFEPNNAARMYFGGFGNKAVVTAHALAPYFADSQLSIVPVEEYVSTENVSRLIRSNDLLLLTVDNHATRQLLNAHCMTLDDVFLISGGNDGVGLDSAGRQRRGTYGNLQVYWRSNGRDRTADLAKYHPEIANPADHSPAEKSCTELASSGVPQILFANLAVASAMLNALWLYLSGTLHYGELALDIADGLMRPTMPLQQGPQAKPKPRRSSPKRNSQRSVTDIPRSKE